MSNHGHNPFHIDRLVGRDNYASWKFAVQAYFELEELWCCVTGTNSDAKKETKAKSKLILLLDPINYVHVQNAITCKDVWENLEKAFDDSGLYRRVALLRDLITTTLDSSRNVDDYVNKIMSSAHKLRNIKFNIDDEWLGTLMLAGLPETYKPMIMGLESSGIKISADAIKTKLLQEVQCSESSAFFTRKKGVSHVNNISKFNKGPRCYKCNKHGHIAKNCYSNVNKKNLESKIKEESKEKGFIAAFSASSQFTHPDLWYVDSGASMHMTNNCQSMYDVTSPPIPSITVASKTPLPVKSMGKVNLLMQGDEGSKIQVRQVLYIPKLAANLLSVSAMVKNGCKVIFRDKGCDIYDYNNKLLCSATLVNNLYQLDTHREVYCNLTCSNNLNDVVLWHRRMGHLNFTDVNKLPECADGVNPFPDKSRSSIICTTCITGKQSRLPFNNKGTRASEPLQLVHSDLCGPMEQVSLGGMKYFATFIDDYTRKVYVYLLKNKSSVLDVFKDFKSKVENELDRKIKSIRSDNGKEYVSTDFEGFLRKHGIEHQTSTPYSPQQNGLAERMNRSLVERAKCMLFDANLSKQYWAEAIATAAYVINRSPTKSLDGKTPIELWSGRKPNLSNLRIFGSEVMVQIPKERRQKWDAKSRKLIFVGYCESTKGYRVLDPSTNKIIKSRDVVFLESIEGNNNNIYLPCVSNSSPTAVQLPEETCKEEIEENLPESSDDEYQSGDNNDSTYLPEESIELETPTRNINLRPRRNVKYREEDEPDVSYFCPIFNLNDPKTLEEALSSSHADQWKKAMQEEYDSLLQNKTWSLVDLPSDKRALPCKWVFKTKINEKGEVIRFKARLVIKGYAQKKGSDYEEVYAPVVRYTSIRYLIALAAKYDLEMSQMDAVSAFLQGDIDTEIYMSQPENYRKNNQVCFLHKSIYGLKQASRQWNIKLNSALLNIGLTRSKIDPCLYYLVNHSTMIFIAVWVDDFLIFTSSTITRKEIEEKLKAQFSMKDLGDVKQCIGMSISRNRKTGVILLDQEKYINMMLERFGMSECKPVRTPIEVNEKFEKNSEDRDIDIPYREAVGCLIYLAHVSRPDITFAVSKLSQFCNNPGHQHWLGVKRVMRYLQGTKDLKMCYKREESHSITGYCDADWAGDSLDRRSCMGYTFLFQNASISWNSCKQQTVALSTAEAEYMAMALATQEALWLQQLQAELGQGNDGALLIYCDNQSAIKLASTDCYKPRTKHIDIRWHFIRENIVKCKIKFLFVNSCNMVADNLTKGTTFEKHLYCITKMGLRSVGSVRDL